MTNGKIYSYDLNYRDPAVCCNQHGLTAIAVRAAIALAKIRRAKCALAAMSHESQNSCSFLSHKCGKTMETNERRAYSYQVRDARGTSLDCEQLMTERVKGCKFETKTNVSLRIKRTRNKRSSSCGGATLLRWP